MYILSILSEGFGNKLFMLFNLAAIAKKHKNVETIYILNKPSKHDLGHKSENLLEIFPNLTKTGLFKIINWKEYDKLKNIPKYNSPPELISESFELVSDFNFRNININSIKPLFKTIFKINYENLNNYDFKNGIFIHIRYGDKLNINANIHSKTHYELVYPKFYTDMIKSFNNWEVSPIYIATDSPDIVRRCIPSERIEIIDEPWWQVFRIFTKAKRVIFGESTLTIGALILNKDYEGRFYSNKKKIYDEYVEDKSDIIRNKKYLIGIGAETIDFIKHCS